MESAGTIAARELLQRYWPELKRGRVAIVCGPGHNGADGLVIARHLRAAGIVRMNVYAFEDPSACKPLFQTQWNRLSDVERIDLTKKPLDLSKVSLVVDALYGIGVDRPLQGQRIETVIAAINSSGKPIVSIDAPSGLDCEKGTAGGAAVKAALTLTFTVPKLGFFTAVGSELCGVLRVLPIGFPLAAVFAGAHSYRLFTESWARRLLRPARSPVTSRASGILRFVRVDRAIGALAFSQHKRPFGLARAT